MSIKKRKSSKRKLLTFWTEDMPRVMYDARSELLVSFLVFAVSMAIGMLSCAMDENFLEVILGNDYTEMTRENIRSGDPMRVYKQRGELSMSLGIAVNNLTVAFLTFVMGVFYTLGTFIVLISNGIMVGAFQFFFIKEGVFVESFLTIWIHGTLEISAIIIAGAAGIAIGKGIVFPSTYSRLKSFQQSARRGLKIMMGIVPIIILAAFFEGFLTRQTETPDLIRGCFILICLVFVISYFVIYPRLYVQKYGFTPNSVGKLVADKSLSVEWLKIKTDSDIIGDTFLLFRKNITHWLLLVLISAATYTTAAFLLTENFSITFLFPANVFGTFSVFYQFFINDIPWMALVVMIPVILLTYLTFLHIHPPVQAHGLGVLKLAVVVAVWYSMIAFTEAFSYILVPFLGPIVLLWAVTSYQETGSVFKTLGETFQLLKKQYGKMVGLFLALSLIGFIFSMF
ncbi:MAG: stage II sporulation protein M [Saprospiraceae bacterium]|nr:stage II sporulation protein M [Saprospiraceae bacterium]